MRKIMFKKFDKVYINDDARLNLDLPDEFIYPVDTIFTIIDIIDDKEYPFILKADNNSLWILFFSEKELIKI